MVPRIHLVRKMRHLKALVTWPFTTSPWEEQLISRLNLWFGGVPGIKQVMLVLVMYVVAQYVLPQPWRFDVFPFTFLVLLVTLVSLTSNQWLMNQTFQAARLEDADKAALHKMVETTMHIAGAIVPILESVEKTTESIEDKLLAGD